MKILITDSAFNDLEQIKENYEGEGVPHVSEDFVFKIIEHIETLLDNPEIGRIVPEFNTPTIRELIHNPFRIVYIKETNSIHVVRVWRSERLMNLIDSSNDNEI